MVPFLLGRPFQPGELHVTIVSESLANRVWDGEDPIVKPVPSYEPSSTPPDIRRRRRQCTRQRSDSDATEQYWPAQVGAMPQMSIVLKAAGPLSTMYPTVKSISQSLDPRVFPEIPTASRALRSTLSGISNLDPARYATAALLLLLIVMIATVLPARRSLHLDIARALHHDQ